MRITQKTSFFVIMTAYMANCAFADSLDTSLLDQYVSGPCHSFGSQLSNVVSSAVNQARNASPAIVDSGLGPGNKIKTTSGFSMASLGFLCLILARNRGTVLAAALSPLAFLFPLQSPHALDKQTAQDYQVFLAIHNNHQAYSPGSSTNLSTPDYFSSCLLNSFQKPFQDHYPGRTILCGCVVFNSFAQSLPFFSRGPPFYN